MKFSLTLLGLGALITLPTLGSAGTLTWNFLNDVPTGSAGVAIASPHSFADTNSDPTLVTASILQSTETKLYEKNGGGDEVGLGISGLSDNEIQGDSKLKLDLSNLLTLNPTSISVALGSVQRGEGGFIEYGATGTGFSVFDEKSHGLLLSTLVADGGYIEIYSTSGNVLVAGLTATTPSSQAPEPADAGFLALGLLALTGCKLHRKFQASKA